MNLFIRLFAGAAFAYGAIATYAGADAQASPAPSASTSPSPESSKSKEPDDPCGSLLSLVGRPAFGTGVCTVRPGHVLLENGYTNIVTTGTGGGNTVTYPETQIRIGTFDPHLEFDVGPTSESHSSLGGVRVNGLDDLSFGAKYELGYNEKADWGVNAVVTVPTGANAFSAGNAQYTANLNAGYAINDEFALAGTLGFNAFSAPNASGVPQSYFAFTPSLVATAALPGGPSQISFEYAFFSSAGPNLGSKSFLNFFYQRDFGPHVQLDVEYATSPTAINGQRQHYVGAGLSFMN